MYFSSKYWPADVPVKLWQFDLLSPEERRNLPFVGIEVSWEFLVAFIAGCVLICVFAWRRFSEPSYDVNTPTFRDFRDFGIWNLKDSVSLRRAYVVYSISLVFIFAALAFFGRIIVQLASQLNVAGLQIDVGTFDFTSWKWPLALALGIAGFAPLINPLMPAEHWLRRFSHEVVGIPTRIREKAIRIRTLIDGAPEATNERKTSQWVEGTLGAKLNGCFELEKNLQTIVKWSYKGHLRWSDSEIRRKLSEYERVVREETETALADFLFLTDPTKVPDSTAAKGQTRLHHYEKRLSSSVTALEQARDKFAIIIAIYCEHGSLFRSMEQGELRKAILEMADAREPRATGLPLYAFILVFITYWFLVQNYWHPLISAVPYSNDTIAVTAVLETLKVFFLIWLPATVVAAATSVIGPERGERPVKASLLWEMIPGAIAAFVVAAIAMALYAMLYAALPASNIGQMKQSLLGRETWTGALPYFLWFAPTAVICFVFVSAVRLAERTPGALVTLALASSAAALVVLYLGWVVGFTTDRMCEGQQGGVTVWKVLWELVSAWVSRNNTDLAACFSFYSTLDILVIAVVVFLSVLGLAAPIRITNPFHAVATWRKVSSLVAAAMLGLFVDIGGSRAQAPKEPKEVVLGFRTDIRPFSFRAPADGRNEKRPYLGYVAELCYEIFDNSPYKVKEVDVTALDRFRRMRREADRGPDDTIGPSAGRADGMSASLEAEKVDVLCDATTIRLDDKERMEGGVFTPIVFVSGVSYLWRRSPGAGSKIVEVGYVRKSTAERVAMEACRADAMRLGNGDDKFECTEPKEKMGCSKDEPDRAMDGSARQRTLTLLEIKDAPATYIDCAKEDHEQLIEWFCGTSKRDKVYFGDRDIIVAKRDEWRAKGKDCGDPRNIRDPQQSFTYEPYALLVSKANGELIAYVQQRIYELFSHRSGAEALFYKWFPGQTMSAPLAWLFLLNGVMDQDELLAGPKQFRSIKDLPTPTPAEPGPRTVSAPR